MSARRVVTLPPALRSEEAVAFARVVRKRGADLLELRTDLHLPLSDCIPALAHVLPLLLSERGEPIPDAWLRFAEEIDRPLSGMGSPTTTIASLHLDSPVSPEEVLRIWRSCEVGAGLSIKHVEPLGPFSAASRLFETQRELQRAFGPRVTVLPTGACALPFRCVLAERNRVDYLALDGSWCAAPGQRLLADAVRSARSTSTHSRLGILGSSIERSQSPRVHSPPFDRIDVPEDTDIPALLQALHPYYRGLAVTAPFKRRIALAVESSCVAINTLIRTPSGWRSDNTDIHGALGMLTGASPSWVTILGGGGAAAAVASACERVGVPYSFIRRAAVTSKPIRGFAVWTWPAHIDPPPLLQFEDASVAVISYGRASAQTSDRIRHAGGEPLKVGGRWFGAQARAQQRLWQEAT